MEKMITKKRQLLPDFLKGLAVIFMIQVHITELFLIPDTSSTLQKISYFLGGPPAAPIFMCIMGYFLNQKKNNSIILIKRGLKLILLGFLINLLMNLNLIYHYIYLDYKVNIWRYIFGVDILFLAGLSTITLAIFRNFGKFRNALLILFLLLINILNSFLTSPVFENNVSKYLMAYIWSYEDWSYFPLFPWVTYPVLGYLYKDYEEKILNLNLLKYKYYFLVLWAIVFILSIEYSINITSNLSIYYHHNLIFVFYTIFFLVGFILINNEYIINFKSSIFTKWVNWIGENVTLIYAIQWFIIGNIGTLIYKSQSEKYFIPFIIFVFIIVILLTKIYQEISKLLKNIVRKESVT